MTKTEAKRKRTKSTVIKTAGAEEVAELKTPTTTKRQRKSQSPEESIISIQQKLAEVDRVSDKKLNIIAEKKVSYLEYVEIQEELCRLKEFKQGLGKKLSAEVKRNEKFKQSKAAAAADS